MSLFPHIFNQFLRRELLLKEKTLALDLSKARQIQNALLNQDNNLPQNIEINVALKQSKFVGGDLYGYYMNGSNLHFFIGDVSGKGMTAALYMSSIHHILHQIGFVDSPSLFCNKLNEAVCKLNIDGMFITIFAGCINVETGVVQFTNAGHMPPIIWHNNSELKYYEGNSDIPVGIIEDNDYIHATEQLKENDMVILYSDGVCDTINEKEEQFGYERLLKRIGVCRTRTPKDVITQIIHGTKTFKGDIPYIDDIVVMAIKYKGDRQKLK